MDDPVCAAGCAPTRFQTNCAFVKGTKVWSVTDVVVSPKVACQGQGQKPKTQNSPRSPRAVRANARAAFENNKITKTAGQNSGASHQKLIENQRGNQKTVITVRVRKTITGWVVRERWC